ncbi:MULTISPECIES: outer membrane protein assembly factor BamB family protein [unclassified Sphingomonas]|uniref:outer membrane protein assembly factor BamB family protein n=1 Tax=unclassified Sphingomonas TaxID=196159 RepID=UPI0006F4AF33|nr:MULTISPECIES: PQQ-like beta-propeller repeat protein [unclassified Sphingomonas]KQM61369.1 pyrrolo-quinoline quinone [Sphingomonas sp. Leaf16]KQN12464.1 pyrrolo-quinoline quinone [Sphingomonas sp. Leaf29]KQN18945.1 pyrrolo-quinoline quinone [Sphingomonas sp. Leaf32]
MKTHLKLSAAVAALALLGGCSALKGKGGPRTPVVGQRVPILASENLAEVDPALANLQVVLPLAETNADWSQPGGNASKSMSHVALGDTLTQAWSARIEGGNTRTRLAAAPVVVGGRLYVIDVNGMVTAMDAASGRTVWTAQTVQGDANPRARFGGGVSVEGDRAFATDGLGDVVAFNTADGNEVWRAKPGGPLRGAPSLSNGQVYVVSQDNQLFALDQSDGKVVWTQSGSIEAQGVFGVAAPASAQGTVVAGFSSGELNAYRYENGRSVWGDSLSRTSASTSVSALADIDAEPVIDNGRVYAVGQGGRMVALELVSGQRLWEQNLAGIATPWVAGEWIFVVTDDARLLCISRGSGKLRWVQQLPGFRNVKKRKNPISWRGPILAGNRLILVNSEGQLVSASTADGSITSTQDTRSKAGYNLSPVVANGMLYLLDDAGQLTAWK